MLEYFFLSVSFNLLSYAFQQASAQGSEEACARWRAACIPKPPNALLMRSRAADYSKRSNQICVNQMAR